MYLPEFVAVTYSLHLTFGIKIVHLSLLKAFALFLVSNRLGSLLLEILTSQPYAKITFEVHVTICWSAASRM